MMNAMDTAVGKIATAVRGNAKLYQHSIIVFSTVSRQCDVNKSINFAIYYDALAVWTAEIRHFFSAQCRS
jgi:hypothetical protein